MKTLKVKVVESKRAAPKRGLYTVNVARMEQFLEQGRDTFRARVQLVRSEDGRFVGVLAGPTTRVRNTK